eukprot:scaffold146101_cov34-Tisochrysis_lutea.AAC.3
MGRGVTVWGSSGWRWAGRAARMRCAWDAPERQLSQPWCYCRQGPSRNLTAALEMEGCQVRAPSH